MTSARPKPVSNAQRAVRDLRQLIISGQLPAGSDHLESELADRLNMSRTPVREAVLTLEGQGLLELRPRKGVRVVPLSVDDMAEIYDVLTELESLAAERAAQAGYTDHDLETLVRAIDDMDDAIARPDLDAWAEADDRFHTELVRLGGNKRIRSITHMMSDQVQRARNATLLLRPLPVRSNDDHRRVYAAIRDATPQAARSIHREHRQHAKEILLDLLQKHRLYFL